MVVGSFGTHLRREKQLAIVTIENVTVQFVNSGKGFKVLEESTSAGKTYKQQWMIWADAGHGFNVGDRIAKISGLHGVKQGKSWTDREGQERQSIDLSINSPRIEKAPTEQPF